MSFEGDVSSAESLASRSSGIELLNQFERDEMLSRFVPVKVLSRKTVKRFKKIHTLSVQGITDHNYCPLCNYRANSKANLAIHFRTHTGEAPFQCAVCQQKFKQKGNLTTHLLAHQGIKRFQCDQCEYKATQKIDLTRHKTMHSGERPFKCDVCGFSTGRKGVLIKHARTHTGEKLYPCTHCPFRSTTSWGISQHILTHTGQKPAKKFSCSESGCSYQASRRASFSKHIEKHSRETVLHGHGL